MEIVAYSFIYGGILLLIIMFIILTVRYYKLKFKKEPMKLLDSTISLEPGFIKSYSSNDIPLPDIKNGDALGVTFAFKLFLENAMENEKWGRRYDQLKPIINYYPGIRYHPYDNYLEFGIEIKDNIQMNSYQTIKYQDPPLQKWLNIVVVYSTNRIIVYLDNEIVVSKKIKNPPIIKPRPLYIGEENNNIKGFLGPIYYWSYPLEFLEIPKATQLIKY
jgi:hypothetical protein